MVAAAVEAAAHAVDRWNNRGPGNAMRHMLQFQEEEAAKPIAKSATELHTTRYHQGHPDHNTDTAVDIVVVVDDDAAAAAAAADVDNNCS